MKKLFFVILMAMIIGCGPSQISPLEGPLDKPSGVPIDYGNGVYFFPVYNAEFGTQLSFFLKDTSVRVLAISGNEGSTGYWVVVEKK
jgi:hypothetical protein